MLGASDYEEIGTLLNWGLDVAAYPGNEPEYANLLRRYINDGTYRDAVVHTALGLGLQVLHASENGIVLAPTEKSLFRLRMADVRSSVGADDRLLEGFIHVAIAATVFPRAELLEETKRRAPVTIEDVESLIRRLCAEFQKAAASGPDPARDELSAGMIAGWRVYNSRAADASGTRRVGIATKTMIQKTLQALVEAGMFQLRQAHGTQAYQPTFRYQTQVREFAANEAYRMVRRMIEAEEEAEVPNA